MDNHYDLITSLTAFYGAPYYCDKCHAPYRNKNNHKCNKDKSIVDKLNRIKKLKSELMEYNIIYENGKMICKNCKIELNEKNQCHECYIQKTELKEKSELYIFIIIFTCFICYTIKIISIYNNNVILNIIRYLI